MTKAAASEYLATLFPAFLPSFLVSPDFRRAKDAERPAKDVFRLTVF